MSKRTATDAELETPWVNTRTRNPSVRVRASAVLESLVGSFVQEENNALRAEINRVNTRYAEQSLILYQTSERAARAARSLDRTRRANIILSDTIVAERQSAQWWRNMVEDIFTRFPEVGHEYDWIRTAEVMDDEETETDEEMLLERDI